MPNGDTPSSTALVPIVQDVVRIPTTEFGTLVISADAIPVPAGRTREQEIERLRRRAERYREQSLGKNSRRVYGSHWRQYTAWCERLGFAAVNGDPQIVGMYVAHLADRGLRPNTIGVALAAIDKAHDWAGIPLDTKDPMITEVMSGIRRPGAGIDVGNDDDAVPGRATPLAWATDAEDIRAEPVTFDLLRRMIAHCPLTRVDRDTGDTLPHHQGLRDRALLLLTFGGALRRAEAVALDIRDVAVRPEGLVLRVRYSKTNQTGKQDHVSAQKGIWRAADPNDPCCPVRAFEAWLAVRGTQEPMAPLFIGLKKSGWPTDKRLSGESVADIVRRLITTVALSDEPADRPWRRLVERDRHGDGTEEVVTDKHGQPVLVGRWSGHSLRSGLATEAGRHSQSLTSIMRQTGHTDPKVAAIYLRESELFRDNVTAAIFRNG
ncbi:site-specific integrase [Azospirillum soli]|uniref:site-specific integrase n=1 Tax=Azospirillum soli TaxID=1304799 RepID=UPI001AE493FE|nr:tyrosine-type recombinase/integrase [Azospirillum soli]MBP2315446.1 integrase [Azospirillum soli]